MWRTRAARFAALAVCLAVAWTLGGFVSAEGASVQQCVDCIDFVSGGKDFHFCDLGGGEWGPDCDHDGAEPGTCFMSHALCFRPIPNAAASVAAVTSTELVAAVEDKDVSGLREILQHVDVRVNIEREALQGFSCGGKVVVHIPLAPELMGQLQLD